MSTHTEFAVAVDVWSLEQPDYQPCPELQAICDLIGGPRFTRSPAELYPSDTPLRSLSTADPRCFLSIPLTADPTDQMDVVRIQICCRNEAADSVEQLLRAIQSRSDVKCALLRGNLGLKTPDAES